MVTGLDLVLAVLVAFLLTFTWQALFMKVEEEKESYLPE
jgi:hypothetical protein